MEIERLVKTVQVSLISLFACVFLLTFTSTSAQSANEALPGESLYTLDLELESLQLKYATSPARQLELRTLFVDERVYEIKEFLGASNDDLIGLGKAFESLTEHQEQVVNLVQGHEELKPQAKDVSTLLHSSKANIETAIDQAKGTIKDKKYSLKEELIVARSHNDSVKVEAINNQLVHLDQQIKNLEEKKESTLKKIELTSAKVQETLPSKSKEECIEESKIENDLKLLKKKSEALEDTSKDLTIASKEATKSSDKVKLEKEAEKVKKESEKTKQEVKNKQNKLNEQRTKK